MCQECPRRGWQALCGELEDLLPRLVQCIRKPGQNCKWKTCQWYCILWIEVFLEGEKQNSKWQGSQTWDSAACCNKSQSRETGAGKRKEIYSSASISRRWGTSSSPQQPIFPFQCRPGLSSRRWMENRTKRPEEACGQSISPGSKAKGQAWGNVASQGFLSHFGIISLNL